MQGTTKKMWKIRRKLMETVADSFIFGILPIIFKKLLYSWSPTFNKYFLYRHE